MSAFDQVVYSKETEWDVTNPDPDYHFKAVTDALKLAKETLPKARIGSRSGNHRCHFLGFVWLDIDWVGW